MQVYTDLTQFPTLPFAVVTSGTFDGVHWGHQIILNHLKKIAEKQKGQTVLITYHPHPRQIIFPHENLKLLNSLEEKIELLAQIGIEHLLIIPFTKEFSQLNSQAFIQKILIETVKTKTLVIGFDHRFGKGREGSFEYLKANQKDYPFTIEEIPRQDIENEKVSSTRIRQALAEGKIREANQYLGRKYTLTGKIIVGDKIGRTIGFPTANLQIADSQKLIPQAGIYAAQAEVQNQRYGAMLYIGNRPVLQQNELRIEAHLLDFDQDIYDQNMTLHLVDFVRNDQYFESLDALKTQIEKDKKTILQILSQEA